jgi:hypothetical protein
MKEKFAFKCLPDAKYVVEIAKKKFCQKRGGEGATPYAPFYFRFANGNVRKADQGGA